MLSQRSSQLSGTSSGSKWHCWPFPSHIMPPFSSSSAGKTCHEWAYFRPFPSLREPIIPAAWTQEPASWFPKKGMETENFELLGFHDSGFHDTGVYCTPPPLGGATPNIMTLAVFLRYTGKHELLLQAFHLILGQLQ